MRNALLISTHFPKDSTWMAGIHRRMDAVVQALGSVSERVTVLLLVRLESGYTESQRRDYEEYLSTRWRAQVSLRLAHVRLPPTDGSRWSGLFGGIFRFHRTARMRQLDNQAAIDAVGSALEERPQIVLMHGLEAMSVLLRLPQEATDGARVFFDLYDLDHLVAFRRLLREPAWPAERLQLLHVPALMAGERQAIRRADVTFVCSRKEKVYLDAFVRGEPVRVIANPTAVSETPLPPTATRTVLFVGSFAYPPNVHAAERLVTSVWPLIRAQIPNSRLLIVGKDPENIPAFSASSVDQSVTFAGFVEDIHACYANSRVVCCPIRVGAGTRVKIIEAAGFARPVVSTPLGAEGLEFQDGTEIILRERDEDLAAACCQLLLDDEQARRIGLAAWERARRVYDRSAVIGTLAEMFSASA